MATDIKPLSKGKTMVMVEDYTGEKAEIVLGSVDPEGGEPPYVADFAATDAELPTQPLRGEWSMRSDKGIGRSFNNAYEHQAESTIDDSLDAFRYALRPLLPSARPRWTMLATFAGPRAKNRWGVFKGKFLLCSRRRKGNAERIARDCGGRVVECNGQPHTAEYRDVEVSFTLGGREDEQS